MQKEVPLMPSIHSKSVMKGPVLLFIGLCISHGAWRIRNKGRKRQLQYLVLLWRESVIT